MNFIDNEEARARMLDNMIKYIICTTLMITLYYILYYYMYFIIYYFIIFDGNWQWHNVCCGGVPGVLECTF